MAISPGAIRAGGAYVTIGAVDQTARVLNQVNRRMVAFGRSMTTIGRNMALLSAGVGLGLGKATQVFASFDDSMRVAQIVTGATADEFARLSDTAAELGKTTSFTAREVAEGMVNIGRATETVGDVENLIKPVLDLARATRTDLPLAGEIALKSLRSFGLETEEAARVVDTLTVTVNNSAQNLIDLFEGVKLTGPLFSQMGTSIEEVSAMLGILANRGIDASLAGTALRRALLNLTDPKIQQFIAANFGFSVLDAEGEMREFMDIMNDLRAGLQGLTRAEGTNVLREIFDVRGVVAARILVDEAGESYDEFLSKVKQGRGIADEAHRAFDAGLGGAMRRLKSAIEAVGIAMGKSLEGPLQQLLETVTSLTRNLVDFIRANGEIITGIAAVTAGIGAGGVALITFATALGGITLVISTVISSLAAIGGIFSTLFAAGPLGWAALAAGVLGLNLALNKTVEAVAGLKAELPSMGDILKRIAADWSRALEGIQSALTTGDFMTAIKIAGAQLKITFLEALRDIKQAIGTDLMEPLMDVVNAMSDIAGKSKQTSDYTENIGSYWSNVWKEFAGEGVGLFAAMERANKKMVPVLEEQAGEFGKIQNLAAQVNSILQKWSNEAGDPEGLMKARKELETLIQLTEENAAQLKERQKQQEVLARLVDQRVIGPWAFLPKVGRDGRIGAGDIGDILGGGEVTRRTAGSFSGTEAAQLAKGNQDKMDELIAIQDRAFDEQQKQTRELAKIARQMAFFQQTTGMELFFGL